MERSRMFRTCEASRRVHRIRKKQSDAMIQIDDCVFEKNRLQTLVDIKNNESKELKEA